jgi:hypothetical protein
MLRARENGLLMDFPLTKIIPFSYLCICLKWFLCFRIWIIFLGFYGIFYPPWIYIPKKVENFLIIFYGTFCFQNLKIKKIKFKKFAFSNPIKFPTISFIPLPIETFLKKNFRWQNSLIGLFEIFRYFLSFQFFSIFFLSYNLWFLPSIKIELPENCRLYIFLKEKMY